MTTEDTRDPRLAMEEIVAWFGSEACRSLSIEDSTVALGALLDAHGLPVCRIGTSLFTAHPEIHSRELIWVRGQGLRSRTMPHGVLDSPEFRDSPIASILDGERRIRRRLWIPEERASFPILESLHREGATDYIVNGVRFGDGRIACISCASDRPSGFTEAEMAALRTILPLAAMRVEVESLRTSMTSLLSVYLGPNAASRVLRGAFRRGTGETLDAAIWFSDLRNFTTLSDHHAPETVVAVLDAHFEVVGAAVEAHGGEILKFIGDAVLAIFPCSDGGPAAACRRALGAARSCLEAMEAARRGPSVEGRPHLEAGIALHLGEVMYGNIGSANRLDFTVIGAAVNVASRTESMCKTLGVPLVLTDAVAQHLDPAELVGLGVHPLRGVSSPVELFTARPSAASVE